MQEIDTKTAESAAQTSGNKKRLTILTIVFAIVIAGYLLFLKTFDPYHYIDLEAYEKRIFSQNGEDGIINKIFTIIEPTSKFCVEFGAGDGFTMSNVRNSI